MLWKKAKQTKSIQEENIPYSYRFCCLYISEKYKHIMFVPFGKDKNGIYVELDNIITDSWPCDFGKLQMNIEETLKRFLSSAEHIKGNWPSYQNSKATSQKSFETDYISIRLGTDITRSYGEGEVERITVKAQASVLEDTYSLIGSGHLLNTEIAQIVIDIFEACMKIRS